MDHWSGHETNVEGEATTVHILETTRRGYNRDRIPSDDEAECDSHWKQPVRHLQRSW
jgi:hypothetical protein